MKPKEKAKSLFDQFYAIQFIDRTNAIVCAKITIKEIMEDTPRVINKYWNTVLEELDKI